MLFLAHTWILRELLTADDRACRDPDVFIYNLSPDILTIHEAINPVATHGIERFRTLPSPYQKAAFVQFHLLVDDMAHYGEISGSSGTSFNPDSRGYCYVKGKALLEPIRIFYRQLGEEISHQNAAYQSHIMVEMAFDRVLQARNQDHELRDLFLAAFKYTMDNTLDEFAETQAWLFDIEKETICAAMRKAWQRSLSALPGRFMSNADHAGLYMDKFNLHGRSAAAREGVIALLHQAEDLVPDYEHFLRGTIAAIRQKGFIAPP